MTTAPQVLHGTRVVSLALNLPGPAALMRCRRMGATCVKMEPPSGDPMGLYDKSAYAQLHEGVRVMVADLKSPGGRQSLDEELARAHVLLTSFRPSALAKLGLDWKSLHTRHRSLSQVAIVGGPAGQAEEPGHDLTYLARHGLIPGLELPATLYADMAGSIMAAEAVLQAALLRAQRYDGSGEVHPQGRYFEVALSDAAAYLALPRTWGLTQPGGAVGGAHAGYRIYPCRDGRVAVAALEPHFARALCRAAGLVEDCSQKMADASVHAAISGFFLGKTRSELEKMASSEDIPLHPLA